MPMPPELRQRLVPLPKLGARFFATTCLKMSPEEWESPGTHFEHGLVGLPITKSSELRQDRGWVLGPTPESSDSAKLCAQCSDIDVDMLCLAWLPYDAWKQGPAWNWEEVQNNRPWCQFCQILADVADREPWGRTGGLEACPFDPARTTLRLTKIPSSWRRESAEPGEHEFWPSGLRLRFEEEVEAGENTLRDESTYFIFPVGDPSLSPRDNIGCVRPVREFIDPAVPRMWIKTCIESHAECAGSLTLEAPDFNIRVVDTDEMSIISLLPGQQYVALSYVWGAGDQPRLQRAFSEVWAEAGALRSVNIPPTIADAIEVTRLIGQRYLWVDALCIVQDDPHDVERQVKVMHSVYYHAYITIVAASGDDVGAGLPGSSHLRPRVDLPRQIYSVRGKQFAITRSNSFSEVESSAWETRAWTFQERLLSRRILYFTGTSMYFECAKTRWYEDSYGEPALQLLSMGANAPIRSLERYSPLFDASWCNFVSTYLGRFLTDSNDILNGVTGVLAAMKGSWGEFHFGIPLNDFWAELVWYWNMGHYPRRAGFPSWSWCGWDTSSIASRAEGQPNFRHFRADGATDRGLLDIFIAKNGRLMRAGMSSRPTPRTDHEHFYNDEEPTHQLFGSFMQSSRADISQMLFFHTSWATLRLDRPVTEEEADGTTDLSQAPLRSSLAWILNPKSNSKIGSIFLPRDWQWDPEKLALHDFIVIVQCEPSPGSQGLPRRRVSIGIYEEDYPCIYQSDGESVFRLMLIRWEAGVAYRVGISSAVLATDWWGCNPQKKLIALG